MDPNEPSLPADISSKNLRVTLPLILSGILVIMAAMSRVIITFETNEAFSAAASAVTHQFSTAFMRIFLEAVPFLLLGAMASAVVHHFFTVDEISKLFPQRLAPGLAAGLLTALILPVGEGGSILLARSFLRKGAGLPSVVVLMLAAPALNLVTLGAGIGSNALDTAFWLRTAFGLGFSILFAFLVSLERDPEQILHANVLTQRRDSSQIQDAAGARVDGSRLKAVGVTTASEFLEFLPYIIAAALLAALIQMLLPGSWIPPVEGGLLTQVGFAGLWAVLSSHTTFGDFLAVKNSAISWPLVSRTMFLSLGILIDVKLAFLYARVFRKKIVGYLAALAIAAAGLFTMVVGSFRIPE